MFGIHLGNNEHTWHFEPTIRFDQQNTLGSKRKIEQRNLPTQKTYLNLAPDTLYHYKLRTIAKKSKRILTNVLLNFNFKLQ